MSDTERSSQLLARRKKIVSNGVGVFNTITIQKAKGAILIDADGREFIDFAGGIGVVNAGHCPEPVVKAIRDQVEKYIHVSFNVVTYGLYLELCEKLAELLPHGKNTKAVLVNTGAEAVENAIKIARQATRRSGVLCFSDAFHGRTMMAMTLTSKEDYKVGCGPFAPEVYRIAFPNYYRYGGQHSLDEFVHLELQKLREQSYTGFDPKNLAAIIIEPVQGEGGFYSAPKKYLEGLRTFCDDHGILLIFDEIQSGFGRTGNWACWQNFNIEPDISTYAKSLGSGMPIAAVLGKAEIMDKAAPGTIGGTYMGNPVCCAAALATIQYMVDLNLNKRAVVIGDIVSERLNRLKKKHIEIGDVRGTGAMNALELVKGGDPQQPDSELCESIIKGCAANGLILLSAGTFKNVVRILSPLVITDQELNSGLDILEFQINSVITGVT